MTKRTVEFYTLTCCEKGCGITWAHPGSFDDDRRDDHGRFFCPNGHGQSYQHKSEAERVRGQLKKEQDRLTVMRNDRDAHKRSASAYKSRVTRLQRAAADGACPCCGKEFKSLAKHMKRMHPEFSEDSAEVNA